jgi:hypothetical protein
MPAQQFQLAALPPAPAGRRPQVRRARRYLEATHASVSGLFDSFNLVHDMKTKARSNAQGRLGRDEVDLLRAALVFTSSGLDASCQTLVRECVPALVELGGSNAATKFDLYLEDQARKGTAAFMSAAKDSDPRARFVEMYIEAKTKQSYQGTGDLKERVRDLLGVANATITANRIATLNGFFTARNDIVHRLDYVDPTSQSVKRHGRSPGEVVKECDRVLLLIADVITAAADVLGRP